VPPVPAPNRSPLLAVFGTVVIDLLGFGLVLPLLPQYGDLYGASGFEVGLLFASFSGMQFLSAPFWGRLSDRVGRRPVILTGLFGSTASYALFALADLVPQPLALLFVSRLLAGTFGGTISTAYAYIADVTTEKERGRGMALVGAAFGIGFTLGPALGGLGWRIAPWAPGALASAFSATALLFAWRRLPEPEGRRERHALSRREAWRAATSAPGVVRILFLTFAAHGCFALWESTLALLARRRFSFQPDDNGWLFAYVGLCFTLAQGFLVRRFMKRVGEWRFTVLGCATLAAGLVAVGTAPNVGVLFATAPVPVLGFAMITPSLASLLSQRTDAGHQGAALGLNQSGASLARIVGPLVGNTLLGVGAAASTRSLPHFGAAGVMALALAVAWTLRPRPPQGGESVISRPTTG
jgi:MFS family permease